MALQRFFPCLGRSRTTPAPIPVQLSGAVTINLRAAGPPMPPLIPPGFEVMPALSYPVWGAVTPQESAVFNDGDTLTFDGIVRMQRVPDPNGSGRMVNLHRVVKADAKLNSSRISTVTCRAEKQYIYPQPPTQANDSYFWPGRRYQFCFAVRAMPGEYPTRNDGIVANNVHLVWQTKTDGGGAAQPSLALYHDIGHNTRYWRRSWNTKHESTWQVNGGPNPDYEGDEDVIIGPFPELGVWHKYIVDYTPGWLAEHEPKLVVAEAIGNNRYTQIVEMIGPNDWNDYNCFLGASYNRAGTYKWAGVHWEDATDFVTTHLTEMYQRNDTGDRSYFPECVATLASL